MPARCDRSTVTEIRGQVVRELAQGSSSIHLDLSAVETFDSAGMAIVVEALADARRRGVEVELVGVKEPVLDFFSLLSVRSLLGPAVSERGLGRGNGVGAAFHGTAFHNTIERVGGFHIAIVTGVRDGCRVVARALGAMALAPFRRESARAARVVEELDLTGNGAIPIVALIAFLLGLILAMQSYVQLKIFAAEIFVADMVAVSVTREIGPLMTAILVAARSGSSIAAQLGTMVINEEVDALEQMGINPLSYLVAPKIVALAIATPCLTMLFCVVAIGGGLLFGVAYAGFEWQAFVEQTKLALKMTDILSALLKSTVFGALIAAVGCTLGIGVHGGPEGVGRATTRAVVTSIFLIIVVDAVFVMLLRVGA